MYVAFDARQLNFPISMEGNFQIFVWQNRGIIHDNKLSHYGIEKGLNGPLGDSFGLCMSQKG